MDKNRIIPFPDKKYNIIYADPPWEYRDKASAGRRGACYKYKTQKKSWIEELQVKNIAADNCVLFLWCTMPQIPVGLDVIKSWGFEHKTTAFTWIKKNKIADSFFWGGGSYTRANPELVFLGLKGKLKRLSASVHSVIYTSIEGHSKKPDETRDRIVQLFGELPRIELFARQKTEGWDVWGDEV